MACSGILNGPITMSLIRNCTTPPGTVINHMSDSHMTSPQLHCMFLQRRLDREQLCSQKTSVQVLYPDLRLSTIFGCLSN